MLDGVDPFARAANSHHLAWQEQISVGFVLGPADASAQLIKIGQTKSIRAIDDNRVRVRNIETALDNRRANQHVDFSRDEARHDRFQFIRIHLAMADVDLRIRAKIGDLVAHALDCLNAIVQKENLTLSLDLAIDGVANDSLIVTADHRFHWQAIERRRLNG